ncbi:MBL fold metallo-hydrolase [Celeribacter persicus]|uniref:Glyoxylase-like metal-dependent hydrolase (Beta-lactamase superfamily II) n=1 Tax=Celeribacter persicus TaxID=1651082 RepID=A0A2T5H5X8_9RHOB|nr:MBL fold metallo-hydrolase [Celeribacter persicus]PTQ66984.1 glyoxylase-like metal-dependent hydrolase (beta-lactamase superfamily II) [Celeribacter persicus]
MKTSHLTTPFLSRRHLLLGAASLPVAASLPFAARAEAPMMGAALAPYRRFKLGAFEVTTLLAGTRTVPDPHTIFGLNATDEEFTAASEANFIPSDAAQFFFTPTLVNTGSELILFDTGLAPEGIVSALSAAGYAPDQVDRVVITHMHGDHIGGIYADAPTFANAAYATGSVEMDHWDMSGNDGFEAKIRPLQDRFDLLKEGSEVASGITAMEAFGHTPGHMAFHLESEGERLILGADFANHYIYSLAHPDWEVLYDADKATAAKTRRKMLDMMATDRVPFIGYHMPFPALGYVRATDSSFEYVPASYQTMIES